MTHDCLTDLSYVHKNSPLGRSCLTVSRGLIAPRELHRGTATREDTRAATE